MKTSYTKRAGHHQVIIVKFIMSKLASKCSKLKLLDEKFESYHFMDRPQVPVKSIALAVFLFAVGLSLISWIILIITGVYYEPDEGNGQIVPLIILAFLTFIPGAYHLRIALYAYSAKPGYSFRNIPEFTDY